MANTKKVKVTDLDETHILVGESGGLSFVYSNRYDDGLVMGMVVVQTEHGDLFLDPDVTVDVFDG